MGEPGTCVLPSVLNFSDEYYETLGIERNE